MGGKGKGKGKAKVVRGWCGTDTFDQCVTSGDNGGFGHQLPAGVLEWLGVIGWVETHPLAALLVALDWER